MIRILPNDQYINEIRIILSFLSSKPPHTEININFCAQDRDTIFHYAARNYHIHLLSWLIENFPNPGSEVIDYNSPQPSQKLGYNTRNALGESALEIALLNNHTEIAKLFIQQRTYIASSYEGSSLHLAIISRNRHLVEMLILSHQDYINAYDSVGNTTLHTALLSNQPEIAKLLIDNGARILLANERGNTALQIAVKKGYSDIVAQFYHGSELHLAVISKNRLLIEILIQTHQAHINAYDSNGNTALHIALLSNQTEIAKLLIDKGAKCLISNAKENTALHLAVKKGYTDIVAEIVAKNLDLHDRNEDGKTALDIAKEANNSEIISLLNSQAVKKNKASSFTAREKQRRIPWTIHLSKKSSCSKTAATPL